MGRRAIAWLQKKSKTMRQGVCEGLEKRMFPTNVFIISYGEKVRFFDLASSVKRITQRNEQRIALVGELCTVNKRAKRSSAGRG